MTFSHIMALVMVSRPGSTENNISLKMTELEEIRGLNCSQSSDCWPYDINLECREEWCVCRQGMEYNK